VGEAIRLATAVIPTVLRVPLAIPVPVRTVHFGAMSLGSWRGAVTGLHGLVMGMERVLMIWRIRPPGQVVA
jgi:hypothetical protein